MTSPFSLGFVSAILPDASLDDVLQTASELNFDCVELMCWPVGKADRRYAGVTHIDVVSIDEQLEEAKFYLDQSLYGEAEAILERILTWVPGQPTATSYLAELAAQREEPCEVAEAEASNQEPDDDSFDVAFLVREALDSDADSRSDPRRREVQSAVEDGMEEIFADFKRGVNEELSAGDIETRFDLGIAYREMGLLEDARVEFEACLTLETRRIDSLHMMALCARDLERPGDAVRYLEQALESEGLPRERRD
ncbi:MAG: tetratricopeptide repeat protein, partial [Planctomycetaceae bacterium]